MPVITTPRLILSLLSWLILAAGCGRGSAGWSFLGRVAVVAFIPAADDEPREPRGDDPRLVEVEGGGHMGFMERAEAYDQEIARFADRVLRPAAPNLAACGLELRARYAEGRPEGSARQLTGR